jgi:plasmid stabilization system protein ParE
MPEKYTVRIMPPAYFKLLEHIEFLARVTPSGAERLRVTLTGAIRALQENPRMYPVYESEKKPQVELRSKLAAKRYRIFYQIKDDTVFVYDVVDQRQNPKNNLF